LETLDIVWRGDTAQQLVGPTIECRAAVDIKNSVRHAPAGFELRGSEPHTMMRNRFRLDL